MINSIFALFIAITLTTSLSCSSDEPEFVPEIGKEHGGGIIFYVDQTRQHGLIAATADQGVDVAWGCEGVYISVPVHKGLPRQLVREKPTPKPSYSIVKHRELPHGYAKNCRWAVMTTGSSLHWMNFNCSMKPGSFRDLTWKKPTTGVPRSTMTSTRISYSSLTEHNRTIIKIKAIIGYAPSERFSRSNIIDS